MFVQFDRTTRYETRTKARHAKASANDALFRESLKQVAPIIAASSERTHEYQEFQTPPDYRGLLKLKQF